MQLQGKLIPVELVDPLISRLGGTVKAKLVGLASRLTPRLEYQPAPTISACLPLKAAKS